MSLLELGERPPRVTRRGLLIGGGAGLGLLVGWALWPRGYAHNLVAAERETILNGFVKVGEDGHVTVVCPQIELGQGAFTAVAQMVADELGADWRTVAVEPAPLNPLYVNTLLAEEMAGVTGGPERAVVRERAKRSGFQVTGGSTTVRGFEGRAREAGAAARALLSKAAAARWDADWRACETEAGFVVLGDQRLRFGDVAAEAAGFEVPAPLPMRQGRNNRLTATSVPRLDLPSKVDGSANFAGDIRLPDMVFASIRQGPLGDTTLQAIDKAAADRIPGVLAIVDTERWVAAIGTNWWAANRALDAMRPRFLTRGDMPSDRGIARSLRLALGGDAKRIAEVGDVEAGLSAGRVLSADYSVGLSPHAALEPMTATAAIENGRLQLWIATQAPAFARAAAARALGWSEERVTVHAMMVGGSFGRKMEADSAAQAATLAARIRRPVQLTWSRVEDMMHDRFRPAAAARLSATLVGAGRIGAWHARIATPAAQSEMEARWAGASAHEALGKTEGASDAAAVAGAIPPYAIPALAIDHHPAAIGVPTGRFRAGAEGASAFFTESFTDELARASGTEPFSFRMGLLNSNPRLALCLSKAATRGGWDGGGEGSNQGIACHSMLGSHVAVLAQAYVGNDQRVKVGRLVIVADVGRVINPDIARQQIGGGALMGVATAVGAPVSIKRGLAGPPRLRDLALPVLADMPEIEIELVISREPPGGVSEVALPPVAPAIANALFAATGQRFRSLPLLAPSA